MIPDFNEDGNLPEGIHCATLEEVEVRFGANAKRQWLLDGLRDLIKQLELANCSVLYLDGSFVTDKANPGDYDLCWSLSGVEPDKINKVLLDFTPEGRSLMKEQYRGDIFPAELPEGDSGKLFLDFFQEDKGTGLKKGIVEISIGGVQ